MTSRNETIHTRTKPRIWNLLGERTRRDFLLQAAAGEIPGIAPYHIFGYDTDLTTFIKLIYPDSSQYYYTDNEQSVIVTSNSNNDSVNGNGARVLRLVGLDRQNKVQQEDIWLRGTTPVRSLGDYRRVLNAFVLSSGTIEGCFGALTLTYDDTTYIGQVYRPFNIMTNGNFTVPKDANAYIYSYGFSMGAPKELFFGVRVTSPDRENFNWIILDFEYVYGGSRGIKFDTPLLVSENTDIELIAYTRSQTNTYISANMSLLLIDKEYDWDKLLLQDEQGGLQKV